MLKRSAQQTHTLTKHRRKGRKKEKKRKKKTPKNRSSSQRIQAPGACLRTRRLPPGPPTGSVRLGTSAPARREPRSPRGGPAGPAPLARAPAAPPRRDRKGRRGPSQACGSQLDTAGGWDVCTPGQGASSAHKAGQEIKSQARPPPPKQRLGAKAWPCLRNSGEMEGAPPCRSTSSRDSGRLQRTHPPRPLQSPISPGSVLRLWI